MTLERLAALAEAYGGDLRRWPQAERGPAARLLESSAAARQALAQAAALDRALDAWQPAAPDAALARRILAAAAATPQAPRLRLPWSLQSHFRGNLAPQLAGLAAALLIGYAVGASDLVWPEPEDGVDVAGLVFGGADWESLQ